MKDDKTRLIDKDKTTLIDKDKTRLIDKEKTTLIDKDKTKLIDKEKTTLMHSKDNVSSIISDAFKGRKIKDYEIKELINDQGGEAYIFLVSKENDKNNYIAKIYKQEFNLDKKTLDKIVSVDSPYVMKILDYGDINGKHYEIMPFYKNGTLKDHIKDLDIEFIKNVVVKEINEGLKAIHDKSLVHNDIKPNNIFLSDDKKHIIIGDFGVVNDLNGRDYATKYVGGLSELFSAPEAYRYTSKKVDYYSFGMTLYHLAFKGDPFIDMSNDRVRGMIANDNIIIDESVDDDLADLIYMLIKNSPKERLDYDGVNDWIKNNSIYKNNRMEAINFKNGDFKINHEFKNKVYTSMYSLIEAMNEDYEYGYKHFINGYLLDDVENATGKQDLALELKEIRKEYKDDLSLAYFITLHRLNPKIDFIYDGIEYKDFNGYLTYCYKHYPSSYNKAFNKHILLSLTYNKDEKVRDIIEKIFSYDISNESKFDLFLSYFTDKENIYYDKKEYSSLQEFSLVLFTGLVENDLEWDKENILIDFLTYKYNFDFLKLTDKDDLFNVHCYISKLIDGYVDLEYSSLFEIVPIKNTSELLNAYKQIVDSEKELLIDSELVEFVKSKRFFKYYSYEENQDKDFISLLKEIENEDDITILAKLYLFTSKDKKYYINHKCIKTIQELVNYLADYKDLNKISSFILKDEYFKVWLLAKGYKVVGGND